MELFAIIPVRDLDTAVAWYSTFLGRHPSHREGDEVMWSIHEDHAWLVVEPAPERAGTARATIGVRDLDVRLRRWHETGFTHEPVEVYGNGVRHVEAVDPDGNRLAFAQAPDRSI